MAKGKSYRPYVDDIQLAKMIADFATDDSIIDRIMPKKRRNKGNNKKRKHKSK